MSAVVQEHRGPHACTGTLGALVSCFSALSDRRGRRKRIYFPANESTEFRCYFEIRVTHLNRPHEIVAAGGGHSHFGMKGFKFAYEGLIVQGRIEPRGAVMKR